MEIRIENGVTIINTQDTGCRLKSKTIIPGVSLDNRNGTHYRSAVNIDGRSYYIGMFDNPWMAATAAKIARQKHAEGKLKEWLAARPHGNSDKFHPYWDEQFAQYRKDK